jgi:hypothetical protein
MSKMILVVHAMPGQPAVAKEIEEGSLRDLVLGMIDVVVVAGPLNREHRDKYGRTYDCWVNDEGRLLHFDNPESETWARNRLFTAPRGGVYDILGPLVIAKSNNNGETLGLVPEEAEAVIAWLNDPNGENCRPMRPGDPVGEPGFTIIEMKDDDASED